MTYFDTKRPMQGLISSGKANNSPAEHFQWKQLSSARVFGKENEEGIDARGRGRWVVCVADEKMAAVFAEGDGCL